MDTVHTLDLIGLEQLLLIYQDLTYQRKMCTGQMMQRILKQLVVGDNNYQV